MSPRIGYSIRASRKNASRTASANRKTAAASQRNRDVASLNRVAVDVEDASPTDLFRFCRPHRDMQFRQLLVRHRGRRRGQQTLRAGGLWKCDHVADRFGAGHQRRDAIDAEGDAAVWRGAVFQRLEQKAELELRL